MIKIKTIKFNLITFSLLLTPIIYAASDPAEVKSLLHAAENGNKINVVWPINNQVVDPSAADEFGWTALMLASMNGHYKIVLYLIQCDIDPNAQNKYGLTALILATMRGHYKIVECLLKKRDIDPDLQDNEGRTALIHALNFKSNKVNINMIKLLIKHGKNLHLSDDYGQTALMYASFQGHETIAKYLIKKSCTYLNSQDKHGQTALIYASFQGHKSIVENLIENNANLNLQDKHRQTPLMYASFQGHEEIVKSLLQNNAKHNLQDKYQKTALYYAKHPRIRTIIKKAISTRKKAQRTRPTEKTLTTVPPFLEKRTMSLFTITG